MSVIFFVDMLGARKKWQEGGVQKATETFNHFTGLVISAIREVDPIKVLNGGIETDSAIIELDCATTALIVARKLYMSAFDREITNHQSLLWLRGSLVQNNDNSNFLCKTSQIKPPLNSISINVFAKNTLDAISIEKSGFKGMRLLIRDDVINDETKSDLCIKFGNYSLIPLRKLTYSNYPPREPNSFTDFLWMACQDGEEWERISQKMSSRLRFSSKDPDEFAQAAATQVVFHECSAIRQSVISRYKRMISKSADTMDTDFMK